MMHHKTVKKVVYTSIVADLFHYGHLQLLQVAKSLGDYLICGILTDAAVESYRRKPIANLTERRSIVSNLKCVDRVITQDDIDPTENLEKIHEEFKDAELVLVHGSDWKEVPGSAFIKEIGGQLVQPPYYERLSENNIIGKLLNSFKGKFKDFDEFVTYINEYKFSEHESKKIKERITATKANILSKLKPLLKTCKIEDSFVFTVSDFRDKSDDIINRIHKKFSHHKIVVRSSAINEDTINASMAGYFTSEINIPSDEKDKIEAAIKKVIDSYKQKNSDEKRNQVLVQSHTEDITMSGVVFTRALEDDSPYYIINYDDSTGQTDTVTKGVEHKTIKISKFCDKKNYPKSMEKLMTTLEEIQTIIPHISLDVEFAINKDGEVIIFQVRPIAVQSQRCVDDQDIENKINEQKKKFAKLSRPSNHLAGNNTCFADMPDWNPAEIIGHNPNHLDYSLYDYIITDSAWHEARTSQGYYNVNPAKLVVLFGNKPYINVRNSFNSFVPNTISKELREGLVDFYLAKLEENPATQDKVEFEILHTCYDLSFDRRSEELLKAGFTKEHVTELREALTNLTNDLVLNSKESIQKDLESIKGVEKDRIKIQKESKSNISNLQLLQNAKHLLDDCRKSGTVQFSRLARLAFIGKIILKSLVSRQIIDLDFYNMFMNSINTVATDMNNDFKLLSSGKLQKNDFIAKYYHLRPGTYDITSMRYELNPDLIKNSKVDSSTNRSDPFNLDEATEEKITKAFHEEGLKFTAKEFLEFTRSTLESREYAKFEFTKNLSDAIELIAKAGEQMKFTREQLAMLDAEALFKNADESDLIKHWKITIDARTKERLLNQCLILPPVIFSKRDFDVIQSYEPRPNFITQKKVEGNVINLDSVNEDKLNDITGSIVLIENGDPGYDWIFTRSPAALITKYGGVASHMSIRCAEFGLPAAIGAGDLFDKIANAESIVMDCSAGTINIIN